MAAALERRTCYTTRGCQELGPTAWLARQRTCWACSGPCENTCEFQLSSDLTLWFYIFSPGIVVEDCLILLQNLLKNNNSNQNFFKEGSYIQRMKPWFEVGDDNSGWSAQKATNLHLMLQVYCPQSGVQAVRPAVLPERGAPCGECCMRGCFQGGCRIPLTAGTAVTQSWRSPTPRIPASILFNTCSLHFILFLSLVLLCYFLK